MGCSCRNWKEAVNNYPELLIKIPEYNWVISWIEVSKNTNFHQIDKYGIKIKYCPFCGNKLV